MGNSDDNDGLWDAKDVARFFRASRSWVYHQAEAGVLPYVRVVGLLRFDPAQIRAFAKSIDPSKGKVLPFAKKSSR